MASPFVWFEFRSPERNSARRFYSSLLEWDIADDGMIAAGEEPFASLGDDSGSGHWLPYVQVEDVDAATAKARELGATVVQEKTSGPAGIFSTIQDPTGARVALWQPHPAQA